MDKGSKAAPADLMGKLEYYFVDKAPYQLPPAAKEAIVKYGPWIDLILLVLLAPAILLALGIGAAALPLSALGGAAVAGGLGLALAALVVQVVLMVAALPGLFARRRGGWNLALLGSAFSVIYSLLSLQVLSAVVSFVVGFYILFQIRSYYK